MGISVIGTATATASGTGGDRTGRINTRFVTATTGVASVTPNASASLWGSSATIIPETPSDCYLLGFTLRWNGSPTTATYGLRFFIGDPVRCSTANMGCFDSAGNFYWSETSNFVIRKMTPARVVTTFIGTGSSGNVNGTGTAASIGGVQGMVCDSAGNLYIAHTASSFRGIKKVTPAGVATTFAGNTTQGVVNGTGTAASFQSPFSLTIDPSDNLYMSDGSTIRKITTTDATVTTLAGSLAGGGTYTDGIGTNAAFVSLRRTRYDPYSGTLIVPDSHRIRRCTLDGTVTTISGQSTSGPTNGAIGVAAFNNPWDVAPAANGNIYIADTSNNLIRMLSQTSNTVSTISGSAPWGSGTDGWNGQGASAITPITLLVHPNQTQLVYFNTNGGNNKIKLVDMSPTGYSGAWIGDDTTVSIVNGTNEIIIAEVATGAYAMTSAGYITTPYQALPVPIRLPGGVRLAVAMSADVGNTTACFVRATFGYAAAME